MANEALKLCLKLNVYVQAPIPENLLPSSEVPHHHNTSSGSTCFKVGNPLVSLHPKFVNGVSCIFISSMIPVSVQAIHLMQDGISCHQFFAYLFPVAQQIKKGSGHDQLFPRIQKNIFAVVLQRMNRCSLVSPSILHSILFELIWKPPLCIFSCVWQAFLTTTRKNKRPREGSRLSRAPTLLCRHCGLNSR